jgi:hypothetical protein
MEMAERLGGMTAFELMERMTIEELQLWVEYDDCVIPRQAYQFAALMAKLDWHKGVKRPDPGRYLPTVKGRPRRRKSFAELKHNFDTAVAASGGARHGR